MITSEEYLLKIYENAFTSAIKKEQESASSELKEIMIKAPNDFVQLSCKCIENIKTKNFLKKIIMTALSMALRPNKKEGALDSIWLYLNENSKEVLKLIGFEMLINSDDLIKNSAGNLIATFFVIDLKNQKNYRHILNSLSENVTNRDIEIQKASIITIGYICESLFNEEEDIYLNEDEIELLLKGILKGMENYSELTVSSVHSLGYSLTFFKKKLLNEELRSYLYDKLVNFLIIARDQKNIELLLTCISCLEEISRLMYYFLDSYSKVVFNQILECKCLKIDSIYIAINEFFKTMLETERVSPKHLFHNFWEILANYSLEFLLDHKETEEDEEGGLSLTKSFFYLLNTINSLYINETQTSLLKFVYTYIENDDLRIKRVALIVFETLLEFSNKKDIFNDLLNGFFGVLSFIKEEDYFLQKQALEFLCKISEFHYEVIMEKDNLNNMLELFLIIIDSNLSNHRAESIKKLVFDNLEILSEKISNDEKLVFIFQTNVDLIINSLINFVKKLTNLHLIQKSFDVIFNFIIYIFNEKQLNNYYKVFQSILFKITSDITDQEIQLIFITSFLINLSLIHNQIKHNNFSLVLTNNTCEYISKGYEFISDYIIKNNIFPEESLYFMAHILTFDKEFFKGEIKYFLKKFLIPCIRNYEDPILLKNCLEAIELLISCYKEICEGFVSDILPLFLANLKELKFNRYLKETLLNLMGYIFFIYPKMSGDYLEDIFLIIEQACEAIFFLLNKEHKEDKKYGKSLLISLIHLNSTIIHGIYLQNVYPGWDSLIEKEIITFMRFLEKICQKEKNLVTPELVFDILGLMMDFFVKKKNENFIDQNFFNFLRYYLSDCPKTNEIENLLNFIEGIV